MIIEKSTNGHQIDFKNQAGYWIGWAGRVNGVMTLKSTAAPLSNDERIELAEKVSAVIGERVRAL